MSEIICSSEKSGASQASNAANEQQNLQEAHCDGESIGSRSDVMAKIVVLLYKNDKHATNKYDRVQTCITLFNQAHYGSCTYAGRSMSV